MLEIHHSHLDQFVCSFLVRAQFIANEMAGDEEIKVVLEAIFTRIACDKQIIQSAGTVIIEVRTRRARRVGR